MRGEWDEGTGAAPQRLWLHNLYLRRDGGVDSVQGAVDVDGTGAEAWLTDITLHGDGQTTRTTYGLYMYKYASRVHAERCTFADMSGSFGSGAVTVTGGSLALVDTAFLRNVAEGSPTSNPEGAVISAVVSDPVGLENVTFVANTGWDIAVYDSRYPVYSDSTGALSVYSWNDKQELPGHAQPLSAAPAGTFLAPDDAWLQAAQAEACLSGYSPYNGAGDVITVPCLNVAGYDALPGRPAAPTPGPGAMLPVPDPPRVPQSPPDQSLPLAPDTPPMSGPLPEPGPSPHTDMPPGTNPLPNHEPLGPIVPVSPGAAAPSPVPASQAAGSANTIAIIGGAVAGVVVVAAAVAGLLKVLARRRRKAARKAAADLDAGSEARERSVPPAEIPFRQQRGEPQSTALHRAEASDRLAPLPSERHTALAEAAASTPRESLRPGHIPLVGDSGWPMLPKADAGHRALSIGQDGPKQLPTAEGQDAPLATVPTSAIQSAELRQPTATSTSGLPPVAAQRSATSTLIIASTAVNSHQTSSMADQLNKLEIALDATHSAQRLLCSRYEVLSATDRRVGGQGCVQFLWDRESRVECAAKFFFARRHIEHERALYADPGLRNVMAATREVCANGDGAIVAANGAILPPFIVLERGESLDEFQRVQHRSGLGPAGNFVTGAQTLLHTAMRVEMLHALGWVHRDLKPGNVLRVPRANTWTLIDFGSAARIGEAARIEFTPSYAAPEVVRAHASGEQVVIANPSTDVWALGLIAYELLTGSRAFELGARYEAISAVLLGRAALPWEGADSDAAVATRIAKLGAFRRGVLQCLNRDPAQRPALASVIASWQHVFTATTTATQRVSVTGMGA